MKVWVEAMQETTSIQATRDGCPRVHSYMENITEKCIVKSSRFEDSCSSKKVYRVVKAIYGLQSSPSAWKDRSYIMLVQVDVDDMIFGIYQPFYGEDLNSRQLCESYSQTSLTLEPLSCQHPPIDAHKSLGKDEDGEDVEMSISWKKDSFLAMQKQTIVAISSTEAICSRLQVVRAQRKVAGKKILISEATIRADLLFDDENGVDCFPKQVIWDTLRDIGYVSFFLGFSFMEEGIVLVLREGLSPLTPIYVRGSSALAAEEELIQGTASFHSTAVPHDSDAVQGTATSQGTAEIQRTADFQVKWGRNKVEGTLLKSTMFKKEDTAHPFFDDMLIKDAAVILKIFFGKKKCWTGVRFNIEGAKKLLCKEWRNRSTGFGDNSKERKGDVEGKRCKKTLKEKKSTIAEDLPSRR
ncbi:hypothetical protein Tco_0502231 [Tanacetum coccineum]|uniref:Uncharacterized protein n=1 Tax=Tanacetum coccineum TaxID=301880 RepID=A0ABQ4YEG7_9ASTR